MHGASIDAAGQVWRNGNMSAGSMAFNDDGTLTGITGPSFSGDLVTPGGNRWAYPGAAGLGTGRYLKLTRTSGLNFNKATSFTEITASGITGITSTGGSGATTGTWQIAADSSGTVILCSGIISVNNAA